MAFVENGNQFNDDFGPKVWVIANGFNRSALWLATIFN